MAAVEEMLRTHPRGSDLDLEKLTRCIQACFECAQTCNACADACLAEDDVAAMRRCIRLDLDCAAVCITTGQVLSRQTEPNMALIQRLLETCAFACQQSAIECESHAPHHEHCRLCAEASRRCEAACNDLLGTMGQRERTAA